MISSTRFEIFDLFHSLIKVYASPYDILLATRTRRRAKFQQSERVRKTLACDATARAVNTSPVAFPSDLPALTSYTVHPAAAAPTALLLLLLLLLLCTRAAGTSLNLKDKSTALSSLFMSKIAIVLCRSSRPESGLYQAVQAGHCTLRQPSNRTRAA